MCEKDRARENHEEIYIGETVKTTNEDCRRRVEEASRQVHREVLLKRLYGKRARQRSEFLFVYFYISCTA